MNRFAIGKRMLLGLALAATVGAPMAASARDGWHDSGRHGNWDRGGWHGGRGNYHRGGHWSGGNWIAGAIVVGAVAGLISQAVAPPPPPPTYYYPAQPGVVYSQPGNVVYEDAPPVQQGYYSQPQYAQPQPQPQPYGQPQYAQPYDDGGY